MGKSESIIGRLENLEKKSEHSIMLIQLISVLFEHCVLRIREIYGLYGP